MKLREVRPGEVGSTGESLVSFETNGKPGILGARVGSPSLRLRDNPILRALSNPGSGKKEKVDTGGIQAAPWRNVDAREPSRLELVVQPDHVLSDNVFPALDQ